MKILVVFHSLTGNTKMVAETVAGELGADLLELKTKKDFGSQGFKMYFWAGMQTLFKAKPALKDYTADISSYDLIIIGTPVWAGNFSSAIRTFLSKEKISGKKAALFLTCGSEPGKTIDLMRQLLKDCEIIAEEAFVQAEIVSGQAREKALKFAGRIRLKLEG